MPTRNTIPENTYATPDAFNKRFPSSYVVPNSDYSVTGNGTTDDRTGLNTLANTTIASDGGTITFLPATFLINSALTFPTNVSLVAQHGVRLKPASGVALTFNGPIIAGEYQIFDLSAGGSVVFGGGQTVNAAWFGTSNLQADATATRTALNYLFASVRASVTDAGSKLHVELPSYDLYTDATIWAGFAGSGNTRHYSMDGKGARIIATAGCAGVPVLDMSGIHGSTIQGQFAVFQDFTVTTLDTLTAAQLPLCGIQEARDGTTGTESKIFRGVKCDGYFALAAWANQSAEETYYDRCEFRNRASQGRYGFLFQSTAYHTLSSANVTVTSAAVSAQQPHFNFCRFSFEFDITASGATLDPYDSAELGAALLIVGANTVRLIGPFINHNKLPEDDETLISDGPAIRIRTDTANSGPQSIDVFLLEPRFHRTWVDVIETVGSVNDLKIIGRRATARNSFLKVRSGFLDGYFLRGRRLIAASGYTPKEIDASAAGVDVLSMDIETDHEVNVADRAEGRISCLSTAPPVFGDVSDAKVAVVYRDLAPEYTRIDGWYDYTIAAGVPAFVTCKFHDDNHLREWVADSAGTIIGWIGRVDADMTADAIRIKIQQDTGSGYADVSGSTEDIEAGGSFVRQRTYLLTTPVAYAAGDRLRVQRTTFAATLPDPVNQLAVSILVRRNTS